MDEPPPGELFFLPTRRVVWGAGAINRLEELLDASTAERALILTSCSLANEATLAARVQKQCGERYAGQFDQLPAHVPRAAVDAAVTAARGAGADTLIAFGGGSVIDAAKAVAAALADEDDRLATLVAVPTTLSGAEFADHYGVTEQRDGLTAKHTYARRAVTPSVVILDSQLTAATPQWLWAGSAVKALDHAVEGMLCSPARPVLDELAEAGVRKLLSALPHSLDPEAHSARQACQIAAWYCYFAPASTTLGLSHRIGHVLGGTYGVPHAFTSGLTLPAVVRAMAGAAPARLDAVTRALGTDAPPASADGDRTLASNVLSQLVRRVGLPTRLRDVGIGRSQVDAIARLVAERYPAALSQLDDTGVSLRGLLADIW